MTLQLTNLNLGGNLIPWRLTALTPQSGKGGYTAGNTVGAAALGAIIGAAAGGGPGAAIGAVAGTGVGLGASAATPGPRSVVPPEALLTFHLTSPATVQPVSYQDASRIEASAAPRRRYTAVALRLVSSGRLRLRATASGLCSVSVCLRLSWPLCLRLPAALRVWLPVLLPPLEIKSVPSARPHF